MVLGIPAHASSQDRRQRGSFGAPDAPLRLTMIGGFELRCRGEAVPLPRSVERLVAFVALRDAPTARPKIAGTLWYGAPEAKAMANLRSALWRLGQPGLPVLQVVGAHLSLAREVTVDLREISRAAHDVIDNDAVIDDAGIDELASEGELLDQWYDDWVLIEREHFRLLRVSALERLAKALADAGRFARAVESALAAIAAEPLRETAHRVLIEIHLAEGNRAQALGQYEAYRRLMSDELDLEPSPDVTSLVATLTSARRRP